MRFSSEKREEECRKVILVPGAQSAEAQKAVSGLVNAMPGGTILIVRSGFRGKGQP